MLEETPDTLVLANYEDGPGFHQTLLLVVDGPDVSFLHYWEAARGAPMGAAAQARFAEYTAAARGGEPPQPHKSARFVLRFSTDIDILISDMRRMCRRWEDGMKKLLKFLCGRIFITGLLLLLQAVWLGVFFWKLAAYSVWLNAAFTLLSLLIVLHILYHDDVSGFKIGWIILILQLPVMGGLLYLLFGGKLPAHRMRRRLAAQHAETTAALGQDEAVFGALRGDDARAAARSRYITATGGYPGLYGFGREILSSGRGDVHRHAAGAGKRRAFHFGILYHTARQNVGRHCGDPQAQGGPRRTCASYATVWAACSCCPRALPAKWSAAASRR